MNFPTDFESIRRRLISFNVDRYAKTRNYLNGSVSYLSPYISRGFLSTRQVFQFLKEKDGLNWSACEKFIQELAWRDYFQQVFKHETERVFQDFKHPQPKADYSGIPEALLLAQTSIEAIDKGIKELKGSGYMHNHMRMYLAALICNVGAYHWSDPARWMYYHLIDGDIASNHLSWQWVAGSFSNKKYYANQSNINRFCSTNQKGSYLDLEYEEFDGMPIPDVLKKHTDLRLETDLNGIQSTDIGELEQTSSLIYNYYNLDPLWHPEEEFQRILLIEPSFFQTYPVHSSCIDFMIGLADNIPDLKIIIGEFDALKRVLGSVEIRYKEHPLNTHYIGTQEERYWLSPVEGYFPSFFKFWNKAQKGLRREFSQGN